MGRNVEDWKFDGDREDDRLLRKSKVDCLAVDLKRFKLKVVE